MNHDPKSNLIYYWYVDKCGLVARNIPEIEFSSQFHFPKSKISSSHYYDCDLDTIFRSPDPKNITLDTRMIKISHVDQKI